MLVFEALSDPRRRHMVELLAMRDHTVGELCAEFKISQPAVSRHLRLLREAGLVASQVDGQRRVYALTPEPLEELNLWLSRYRVYWRDRLEDLGVALQGRPKKGTKGR